MVKVDGDKEACESAKSAINKANSFPLLKNYEIAAQLMNFDIILEPEL